MAARLTAACQDRHRAWYRVDRSTRAPEELIRALRSAIARGASVASICSGAFVLALPPDTQVQIASPTPVRRMWMFEKYDI